MQDNAAGAYWERIAQQEPYWAVLTSDMFRREQFDAAAREAFFSSGKDYIADRLAVIRKHWPDLTLPVQNALDFGSGVGRLAFAMRDHAAHVAGVDVAATMRDLMRSEAETQGLDGLSAHANIGEAVAAHGAFDWINSYIVFQHIPPSAGLIALEQLVDALRPGGVLDVYITTYKDGRLFHYMTNSTQGFQVNEHEAVGLRSRYGDHLNDMKMFDYDLNAVFALLSQRGIGPVLAQPEDQAGQHGLHLTGRKL